jgi:hypothetical protein
LGRTGDDCFYFLNVGFPGAFGFNMGVADSKATRFFFSTIITSISHFRLDLLFKTSNLNFNIDPLLKQEKDRENNEGYFSKGIVSKVVNPFTFV